MAQLDVERVIPPDVVVRFFRVVARGEAATVAEELRASPALATAALAAPRHEAPPGSEPFLQEISHQVYAGDTALHVAAAGYLTRIAALLIEAGAGVCARNRRGAQPLHYGCDGVPGSHRWNPEGQAGVVRLLLQAGAAPNALDKSGVSPLHRAVRTRSASAVQLLLEHGADPALPNRRGTTPLQLALVASGRGGTGSAMARAERERIIRLLSERIGDGA